MLKKGIAFRLYSASHLAKLLILQDIQNNESIKCTGTHICARRLSLSRFSPFLMKHGSKCKTVVNFLTTGRM